VICSNIVMRNTLVPFTINGYYACGAGVNPNDMTLFDLGKLPTDDDTPIIKNISISNIWATNVKASAG